MDIKKGLAIGTFVIFGIIVIAAIYFAYNDDHPKQSSLSSENSSAQTSSTVPKEEIRISPVINHTRFVTVNDCINRFYGYLSSRAYDKALNVLSPKYVIDAEINYHNIIDRLNIKFATYSYVSEEMYFVELKNNITLYYVRGYLVDDAIETANKSIELFFEVYLDQNNMTFSLNPYNGEVFK